MITGRCECAKITYQIDGEITDYSHCHCGQCRRTHGAEYASFGAVKRTDFTYLTGEDYLTFYSSSANIDRLFCKNCGSNIMGILDDEPDLFYVTMGTMDGHPKLPPEYHIHVASKAPWHTIRGDGAQYDTYPEDE